MVGSTENAAPNAAGQVLPVPGKIGRGFRAGDNTCPSHRDGVQTWAQYVESEPHIEYTKS
ncbi:hypothetical protein [Nocardia concava]|uniref:hypothetical protein n=1 Tax=Nocardia concava TaxID=257281 RepID=UPI0002DC7334|nr:hypothetical protein [Nocardia concava]